MCLWFQFLKESMFLNNYKKHYWKSMVFFYRHLSDKYCVINKKHFIQADDNVFLWRFDLF